MFNQWWWSSGAEANDSGVEIKNSLRFRNSGPAYLTNTGLAGKTLSDYTISVWVKRGFPKEDGSKFILTSGSAGTNTSYLSFTSDGTSGAFNFAEMDNGNIGGTWTTSSARHRDPLPGITLLLQMNRQQTSRSYG